MMRCVIAEISGFCLALRSPCLVRGCLLLCFFFFFFFFYGLYAVCLGLFSLSLGISYAHIQGSHYCFESYWEKMIRNGNSLYPYIIKRAHTFKKENAVLKTEGQFCP